MAEELYTPQVGDVWYKEYAPNFLCTYLSDNFTSFWHEADTSEAYDVPLDIDSARALYAAGIITRPEPPEISLEEMVREALANPDAACKEENLAFVAVQSYMGEERWNWSLAPAAKRAQADGLTIGHFVVLVGKVYEEMQAVKEASK